MKSNYFNHLGLNEPWAIHKEYAQNYFPVLAKILRGDSVDLGINNSEERFANKIYSLSPNSEEKGDYQAPTPGSIAVISLNGPVMKYSQFCGPQGTVDMAQELKNIENNPNYIGTIFLVESGGGQAYAMKPLTDQMDASVKPIVVLGGNVIASAAYGIASHADEIIVDHPRAMIGSIGTMSSLQNVQPALEKMGVEFHEIYATKSTLKNETFRLALEGKYDKLRSELDLLNEDFIADIQAMRPGISADKRIFAGEVFSALEALELGMIDGIGNMQMAIDRVKALNNQSIKNPKSEKMNFEKINSLIGVKSPTSEVLAQANAELTLAGITSARIVSEEAIAAQEAEAAANATLSADLEVANTAIQTVQAELATAQENLNLAQSENAELRRQVEAFGKNAGASHQGSTGADEITDIDDVDSILDALPHNRKADGLYK